ncbi:unnamed protein product [Ilex paraguariensis]|uniref:MATH domain-containing protein n=1 Tax=Ilex paraguariensis TaxID=185542 RepID=A0ABC8USI7_9AQUA
MVSRSEVSHQGYEGSRSALGILRYPQPLEACQTMQVVQGKTSSTVKNQALDELHGCSFTWTVERFSRLLGEKFYSSVSVAGGYEWKTIIYPGGDHFVIYIEMVDSRMLPYGWSRYARFSLAVVNQMQSKLTIRKGMFCTTPAYAVRYCYCVYDISYC